MSLVWVCAAWVRSLLVMVVIGFPFLVGGLLVGLFNPSQHYGITLFIVRAILEVGGEWNLQAVKRQPGRVGYLQYLHLGQSEGFE